MIHFLGILACLFSMASIRAEAEEYLYAGRIATCVVRAYREEVGIPKREIGIDSRGFGFQLFKSLSTAYPARLTAFIKDQDHGHLVSRLNSGGIPNSSADQNWLVSDNNLAVGTQYSLPGVGNPFDLQFTVMTLPGEYGVFVKGEMEFSWSLDFARQVLIALGDSQTPDFLVDPPIAKLESGPFIDFSSPRQIRMDFLSYRVHGWERNPSRFDLNNPDGRDQHYRHYFMLPIQLHYPAEKHNGLSYHLEFTCGASNP